MANPERFPPNMPEQLNQRQAMRQSALARAYSERDRSDKEMGERFEREERERRRLETE